MARTPLGLKSLLLKILFSLLLFLKKNRFGMHAKSRLSRYELTLLLQSPNALRFFYKSRKQLKDNQSISAPE